MKDEPIVREVRVRRPGAGRQWVLIAILLLFAAGAVGAGYLLFVSREEVYVLRNFPRGTVERRDIKEVVRITGRVYPSEQVTVAAPFAGLVAAVHSAPGDDVGRGQLLAELESAALADELVEARITLEKRTRDREIAVLEHSVSADQDGRRLERLKRDLRGAEQDLSRLEAFSALGSAAPADVLSARDKLAQVRDDNADLRARMDYNERRHELALTNIDLDIRAAQDRRDRTREAIENMTIRAPISGRVLERTVNAGSSVSAYGRLYTIADLTDPLIRAAVPERDARRVEPGQDATATIASRPYPAYVASIAQQAIANSDAVGATVEIEIRFHERPEALLPGGAAAAEITTGLRRGALRLPRGLYYTTGHERYVFKILGDRAVRTEVVYGMVTGSDVEILSGLSEGDVIVTSSYQDFIHLPEIRVQ